MGVWEDNSVYCLKFLLVPTQPVKVKNVNLMGQDDVALKNKVKQKQYYWHIALERVKPLSELCNIRLKKCSSLLRVIYQTLCLHSKGNRTKILASGSPGLQEYTLLHGHLLYFHNHPALQWLEVTAEREKCNFFIHLTNMY